MFLFLILCIYMYNSVYGSVLVQYMCIDHSIFIHFLVIVGHKGCVCFLCYQYSGGGLALE